MWRKDGGRGVTKEEALHIFYEPGRINPHIIQANDEQSQKYNNENIEALMMGIEALKERKKGKWIVTYSDCGGDVWVSWKCSNCNYVRKKGWEPTNDGEKPDVLFCEICGADLGGE